MHAILRSATLFVSLVLAGPLFAGTILDAAGVAEAIGRGAVVWDARDVAAYRQGHLPGAVTVAEADRVLRLPGPQEFAELVRVEKSLGEAGIDLDREIVVYANRGSPLAYAALAAAQYFGARNATVFHDGIEGWHDSGRAIETGDGRRTPVTVRITPDPRMTITTDEVLARLNTADVQIVDARTPDEYAGRDVRGPRGGHIPGAVNIPYETNWVDSEANLKLARRQVNDTRGMTLRSEAELRRLYAGLDPAKETIVYCQTGGRASETFGVLKELGFSKVRLYKPSWAGWAGRADAPVAGPAPAPRP
ncbi:MAG: sulfurtransferase [Rhodoplanes sp.]|uniref:sulfurtransferase n=1 Tax=Rhodoplanes sp. TaxID=1968906 RepID=UPI001846EF63|nr:rhodanese-like domain-containing protein [Rhodoplanes sp.]NVO18037.1 sulfurtransferase [Rhodoplanes sp.]